MNLGKIADSGLPRADRRALADRAKEQIRRIAGRFRAQGADVEALLIVMREHPDQRWSREALILSLIDSPRIRTESLALIEAIPAIVDSGLRELGRTSMATRDGRGRWKLTARALGAASSATESACEDAQQQQG